MAEHGERSCYVAGCRRPECRAANTAYQRAARARRHSRPLPAGVSHGKAAYVNWGCRCAVCTAANRRPPAAERWRSLVLG